MIPSCLPRFSSAATLECILTRRPAFVSEISEMAADCLPGEFGGVPDAHLSTLNGDNIPQVGECDVGQLNGYAISRDPEALRAKPLSLVDRLPDFNIF